MYVYMEAHFMSWFLLSKMESATQVQILDSAVCICFMLMALRNAWLHFFSPKLWVNSKANWVL